jgi:hypothetical protein
MLNWVQLPFYKLYDTLESSRTLAWTFLSEQGVLKNEHVEKIILNLRDFENSMRKYSPATLILGTLLILFLYNLLSRRISKFWETISKFYK